MEQFDAILEHLVSGGGLLGSLAVVPLLALTAVYFCIFLAISVWTGFLGPWTPPILPVVAAKR